MLDQALSYVVDNAIKYSHEGKEVRVYGRVEGKKAYITIEDFGLGITIEEIEKGLIFREGYRSKFKHRKDFPKGSGLGLSHASKLIKLLDGDITARSYSGSRSEFSTEGKGYVSAFTLILPT